MTRNMGALDRGLRTFVLAPVAIVLAFVVGVGTVGAVILFAVAGAMLGSSAVGYCPTYTLLGISTYPRGFHRTRRGRPHGAHA